MVIGPRTKSFTWGWKGTQILWFPNWQPSH